MGRFVGVMDTVHGGSLKFTVPGAWSSESELDPDRRSGVNSRPGSGCSPSDLRGMLREELRLGLQEIRDEMALISKRLGGHDSSAPPKNGSSQTSKLSKVATPALEAIADPISQRQFSGGDCRSGGVSTIHQQGRVRSNLREAGNSVPEVDVEFAEIDLTAKHRYSIIADPPGAVPDAGHGVPKKPTPCWTSSKTSEGAAAPANSSETKLYEFEDASATKKDDDGTEYIIQTPSMPVRVGFVDDLGLMSKAAASETAPTGSERVSSFGSEKSGDTQTTPDSPTKHAGIASKSKKMKKFNTHALLVQAGAGDQKSRLQRITSSRGFEIFSGTLILINAVYLGWQTQHLAELYRDRAARKVDLGEAPLIFVGLQIAFTVAFTCELAPRWWVAGFVDFFRTDELWWNLLDIVVVFNGWLEMVLDAIARLTDAQTSNVLGSISALRLLRIVRIVRVVRVIRIMKFFRELRMMIYSILGSMKNLMWVMMVLGVTFYLFGVTFTGAVINHLQTIDDWNAEKNSNLLEFYGTVDKSALNLYMAMSGGNDWSVYYHALEPLPLGYRWFFLAFISFTIFAIVNIVTGVFVEAAMQSNLNDRDIIAQEELSSKKRYLDSMKDIFEEMDGDGQGTLSMEEFESKLQDERVVAFFNALKLNVSDARVLFRLIDTDKSGDVTIDEFLKGCYTLQGESRSLDMKIMELELSQLFEIATDVQRMMKEMESKSYSYAQREELEDV